ncbi:hypothetical protein [uncultured Chryseobacterium sp.]|uniref:hypothetical protein n=1 Tax=uncultured Chryseobacterium sp. TaxID=259322 RepID=UPI0025CCFB9D|nr:hypothetical protein [uncultured Chryseobacterium sp.]
MKTLCILAVAALLTASCNTTHKATLMELKNKNSNYQMSYDAMRRGAVLNIDSNGNINKILSEVQPDAAIATTTELTSKLAAQIPSGQNVSLEQITRITETLSKLGERTAPVNMLRDALYRLEEHCINFKEQCQGDSYWTSFNTVVSAITNLQKEVSQTVEAEAEKAKAEAGKLEQETKKIKEFKTLTPEDKAQYNLY